MRKRRVWRIRPADPALLYILQHELGVSPVLARLLANRGVSTVEEARLFLEGGLEEMHDPYLMADMDKAVRRIRKALENGEKILVYGDYDADGTTATALLVKVLKGLGGRVGYYVPNRMEEGYGLHPEALARAGREGYGLVVTVDCGVNALEEVARNRAENGPDIVITDHHEPPGELPRSVAVVNPKRADCPYPFKELAGVGVALKLAHALLIRHGREAGAWTRYLDLACLGTVADIVPLTGENRIIVKHGLPALVNTGNPGIKSLMEVSGIRPDRLETREVAFALAPRLNAAGRIGDPGRAVDLLLTGDSGEAAELAAALHRGNQERQRIESLVLAEAMGMLDADPELLAGRVLVLASPRWHPGVVGIVASRLVERYYRPALLIALDGDEGKGSGRSIPGFHLYEAVSRCGELLSRFGGHAQAVGFSISADRVDVFRRAINEYADRHIDGETFVPGMDLDAAVSLREITEGLVEEINMLAPFGHCNPEPVLACREVALISCREIGRNGGHLKMVLKENSAVIDGIAFKLASSIGEIAAASEVDLAFSPSVNQWRGRRSLQLEVKDIRPAGGEWQTGPPDDGGLDYLKEIPGSGESEESLKRLGPLAFLPEFVSAALHRYRESSPHFMFPGRYLEFFTGRKPSWKSQTAGPLRMLKERRIPCRWSGLRFLAGRDPGSLVLVNSPGRAVEAAIFLSRSGVPAGFLHPGVVPERIPGLLEGFHTGGIALVCTYMSLRGLEVKPRRIILFDPPYSPGELGPAMAAGAECRPLFGEDDLRAGLEYLESLAPGRRRLADLYKLIRASRAGNIDPDRTVESMRRLGLARAGLHTLAFGLSVFADLDLIEYRLEGNGYRVKHTAGHEKRDLMDSAVFRAGQEMAALTEKWWRGFDV
ncbi:MAG: single-stranded-DNA-specific exonuclease RecJ [Peptococcaceae bacterium]|nr:single-stranded-DNA-specific exonuclease RecJ [Peptococcaceae bacterium]